MNHKSVDMFYLKGEKEYERAHDMRKPNRKPFVAWDGEGITSDDGKHHYVLFGSSMGYAVAASDLSTQQCLEVLIRCEQDNPDVYHVIFAGDYDVNMIVKDIPIDRLERFRKGVPIRWNNYRLEYRKGKYFQVSSGPVTVKLFDVWSFFGCAFVKAIKEYLGDIPELTLIEAGKAARSDFTHEQIADFVKPYWEKELELLVKLMNKLREHFVTAGFNLSQWYGPGALASKVLSLHHVKRHMEIFEAEIYDASRFAYFGGRFEQFRIGHTSQPVYQYDIRSAYPAAMFTLPSLKGGTWEYVKYPTELHDFALYHIKTRRISRNNPRFSNVCHLPMLFPYRWKNGAVYYPRSTRGWYWGIEAKSAILYNNNYAGLVEAIEIDEGYVFHEGSNEKPFRFIYDYYRQRAEWKQNGVGAQVALKLALNSLYGKTAQQKGWKIDKLPTFHQLEWAGYITAATRAKITEAIMQDPDNIIATETDAVFSLVPLNLPISTKLGDWDETKYSNITYLQSGYYWAEQDGNLIHKFRGVSKNALPHDKVLQWLSQAKTDKEAQELEPLEAAVTIFHTMGTALGRDRWRTWEHTYKQLNPFSVSALGKRRHASRHCRACESGYSFAEALHNTWPTEPFLKSFDQFRYDENGQPDFNDCGHSYQYAIEWLDGKNPLWDSDGNILAEIE